MLALFRGTLRFTPDGCPTLGRHMGVVWPAGYRSLITGDGEPVVVTADGRDITAGDTVIAGGGVAGKAPAGMACIRRGARLTYIQSEVRINSGD